MAMKAREFSHLASLPAAPRVAQPTDRASVEIYRPFFLAGILCVLTVGCLLGAIALYAIGSSGTYTSSSFTPYILAHANSQLFGWVGFFVLGFALQQHAPMIGRLALYNRLAKACLLLMATGIALRFVAEPMVMSNRDLWVPVGVLACTLQALAVSIFLFNVVYTRHRSSTGLTWQIPFVFASLLWLVVVSFAEPFVFFYSHQANHLQSIAFVAKWYPVLREAQFFGFVAMMIFGVSLVKLHSCFGAKQGNATLGQTGFILWTLGLLMRTVGWISAYDQGFAPGSQIIYFSGGVLLAIAAVLLVSSTRIFEPLSEQFRSHKFIRGAFAWLLVSGLLLILEPLHVRITGAPFSHAYTGAIRHAVTVGFISQMILGFGAHVVARMNDLNERVLPCLWSVFFLVNVGNICRVVLEIATDYSPSAFAPMGVTGFVELVGLGIWGVHLTRLMLARRQLVAANVE